MPTDPPGRAPTSFPMPNFKDQSDSVSPGSPTDLPHAIAVTAVPVVSTLTPRYDFSFSGESSTLRRAIVCGCSGVVTFLVIFATVVGILCGTAGRCSSTRTAQTLPVARPPGSPTTTASPIGALRPTPSPSDLFETIFPTLSDPMLRTQRPTVTTTMLQETDSPSTSTTLSQLPAPPTRTERPTVTSFTAGPTGRPVTALPTTTRPSAAPVTRSPTTRPTKVPTTFAPTERPTESPIFANVKEIVSIVNEKTVERVEYPADGTPEEKALKWLVEMDPVGNSVLLLPQQILQRYVLAVFWFQSNNIVLQNWMTGVSECEWEGIRRCNANGVIIEIYFENFGLQGRIPPDLGILSDGLQKLDIDGNQFVGTIPSTLALLTKLTLLDLGPNYLEGTIPTELGRLVNLELADFRDNSLTGTFPSFVTRWTMLRRSLWYNNELEGSVPLDCSIGYIHLVVDCDTVVCPCCTHCCPGAKGPIPSYDDECEGDKCTCTPTKVAP